MLQMQILTVVMAVTQNAEPPLAAPPASDLLAGPTVETVTASGEIFTRDFSGRVERIVGDPWVAALHSMNLSEAQGATVDELLTDRLIQFDRIVGTQYPLILEAGTVNWDDWSNEEGNAQRIRILQGLFAAFAPYNSRGTIVEELRGELPDELLDEAHKRAHAYYAAATQGEMGSTNARAMHEMTNGMASEMASKLTPELKGIHREALRRIRLEQFISMITESFERQFQADGEWENIIERLSIDPQQQAQLESIFSSIAIDEFQRKKIAPRRQFKAITQAWAILRPAQRKIFLRDLAKGWSKGQNYRRLPGPSN